MKEKNNIIKLKIVVLSLLVIGIALTPYKVNASINSGKCGDNLSFTISYNSLIISGNGNMDNYNDENMAPWYENRSTITNVVIENGVTNIGILAFYGLDKITSITLGNTVKSIGSHAFKNCTSLRYINFPKSLESIGESAFENCSSLNGVVLNNGLKRIGDFAFYRCSSLSSIVIPETVVNFGSVVFAYCDSLLSCDIKTNIIAIPDWTFYNCKNLTTVTLPKSVTASGDSSFHNCDSLNGIYYTGDSKSTLVSSLNHYDGKGNRVINSDPPEEFVNNIDNNDKYKDESEIIRTVVTESDSLITITTGTESTYTIDGEKATFEETINEIIKNDNRNKDDQKDVVVSSNQSTVISTTINEPSDWEDLNKTIKEVIEEINNDKKEAEKNNNINTSSTIIENDYSIPEVEVHLTNDVVSKDQLSGTAGEEVIVKIISTDGDEWIINQSNKDDSSFGKKEYDFDINVEEVENPSKTKIKSDEVYNVNFSSNIDFDTTVGINVNPDNSHEYATLYRGKEIVDTVIIDNDGYAWFDLSNINKKSDYYIGINVEGVDKTKASIPDTLKEEFGVEDSTLTDARGNKYIVGGRTSKWGITGNQFLTYVLIAVGALIIIVSGVMITINKIKKNKEMIINGNEEKETNVIFTQKEIEEMKIKVLKDLINNKKENEK